MLLEWIHGLPGTRRRLLYAVLGLLTLASIGYLLYLAWTYYMMDVEVFQDAGWALRRGQAIYGDDFPSRSGYAFIYPPFAAVLFAGLTLFGPVTLQVIWTVATIVAVALILHMVLRRLQVPQPWTWTALLLGVAVWLNPIYANFQFGQINVFLALLIVADVLGFLPKWARGLGVGIAAGIKITPAAYALIFLVRGRWGDVLRSFLWFLVTAAIGFIARPSDSVYFWTDEFFATNRGGNAIYEANQAFSGLLARAGLEGAALQAPIYAAFLAGAIAAGVAAWKLERAGKPVLALTVVALAVCSISPYAVSHHWSIMVLALPLLLTLRGFWPLTLAAVFWVAVTAGAYWLFADGYAGSPVTWDGFNLPLWIIGNSHGLMGLIVFITLCWFAIAGRTPEEKASALVLDDVPAARGDRTAAS